MKQSRRHELKTNELSIYLQQCYDFIRQHATWLIGGVAVGVLIIVVMLLNAQREERAMLDAYTSCQEIRRGSVVADMDHRRAVIAGALQKLGALLQRRLDAVQLHDALAVGRLAVDQDEGGLGQRRRRVG